jgi:taurine dioxygenase
VLIHPISGRKVLYCSVGHVTQIDGLPHTESDQLLSLLFEHQLNPKYQYAHHWSVGDVLVWDNIATLHNAVADYGPDEHRLIKRCQVMADWVLTAPNVRELAGPPS